MLSKLLRLVLAVTLACALVPAAAAQTAPAGETSGPGVQRAYRGQLGASINNPGLQQTLELVWTKPTSSSANPLLSDAHVAAGVVHILTPAVTRLGGWVEYSPLSVLDLRAGADPSSYFGTFNSLMSFDAYSDPFDSDTREAQGDGEAGVGLRLYFAPTLKMKAGPVVMQASVELDRWWSSAAGPLFFEPRLDTLISTSGGGLANSSALAMYQWSLGRGGTLSAGAIHQQTYVFDAPANRIQRVGFIAVRDFGRDRFWLPNPRLTIILWYFLDDPSRKGQWGGAVAIGFRRGR